MKNYLGAKLPEVSLPEVSKEADEAIKDLRSEKWTNEQILKVRANGWNWPNSRKGVNDLDFDTLARALLNGYTVEKSSEDKVHEYYNDLCKLIADEPGISPNRTLMQGQLIRTKHTLELLDVKIDGLTAE